MRTTALLAGAALALGLALTPSVHAHGTDARIWVSLGDVVFTAGVPYHRYSHQPLFIEAGRHGPRYYHYGPSSRHFRPGPVRGHVRGYAYDARYYLPPPPPPRRAGYHRHRPGY